MREEGRLTLTSPEQPQKVFLFILLIDLGIDMFTRLSHLEKAFSPISLTDPGRAISESFRHPANALSPIPVTDDGIIVVDYKTNNSKREEFYIDKYKKQLDLYAEVASSSLDKKVIKKLIYSFALKKFIRV